MTDPDVVIPVRVGDRNEELRYALRSIAANLPHSRVWIVGHRPKWTCDVGVIQTQQYGTKYTNSTNNLVQACRDPRVSEDFVLWNDDFFLLRPIDRVPVMHRGPLADVLSYYGRLGGRYFQGMYATALMLELLGVTEPLSYELHVPLPMRKADFLQVIDLTKGRHMPKTQVLHKRTLYGNLMLDKGVQMQDVKVAEAGQAWAPGGPWLSTSDSTWMSHPAGAFVRSIFTTPGPYEKT